MYFTKPTWIVNISDAKIEVTPKIDCVFAPSFYGGSDIIIRYGSDIITTKKSAYKGWASGHRVFLLRSDL